MTIPTNSTEYNAIRLFSCVHIDCDDYNVKTAVVLRVKLALLNAFERRLNRLTRESLSKCFDARTALLEIDHIHPEYKDRYEENYVTALQQSEPDTDTLRIRI
jgi:hypothetical protein